MFTIIFALRKSFLKPFTTSLFKPFSTMAINSSANGIATGIKTSPQSNGDINNTAAARAQVLIEGDISYTGRDLSISSAEDDAQVRQDYRPFLLADEIAKSDWVAQLELNTALQIVDREIIRKSQERLKVLVLYGSLRERFVLNMKSQCRKFTNGGTVRFRDYWLSKPREYCLDLDATFGFTTQLVFQ